MLGTGFRRPAAFAEYHALRGVSALRDIKIPQVESLS